MHLYVTAPLGLRVWDDVLHISPPSQDLGTQNRQPGKDCYGFVKASWPRYTTGLYLCVKPFSLIKDVFCHPVL